MVNRKATMPVLLMTAMSLASCNESVWNKSPNVIGSAIVERIERDTRYNTAFASSSTVYDVKLSDGDPAYLKRVKVSGKTIEDSDMARSIGIRVAIKCFREDPGSSCYASSYSFDGRELVVQAK
jgi:hypothetical protein